MFMYSCIRLVYYGYKNTYIYTLIIAITAQNFLTEGWNQNIQWASQYHVKFGFCLGKSMQF